MNDNRTTPNESYENISGTNVNIKGTQHGNIHITHTTGNSLRQSPEVERVNDLIQQLRRKMEDARADQQEDVETVEMFVRQIATEVVKEQPNKTMLHITGESLIKAAKNLLSVAPIATEIAQTLLKIK
jgi:hypothetical protein